ncbi:hypothetical protein BDN72DRAFT_831837, partial [Pluteus cervinus]
MAPKLSVEARRVRMLIVAGPIMAASGLVLYKRLVLDEPQRKLPNQNTETTSTLAQPTTQSR